LPKNNYINKKLIEKTNVINNDNIQNWNLLHWTPIKIDLDSNSDDPILTLCKLDFQNYSKSPNLYPMFKILVAKSNCYGNNIKTKKLSILKEELLNNINTITDTTTSSSISSNNKYNDNHDKTKGSRLSQLDPSGFVFHESRVGSTLVANIFASGEN
jgi:hypothetical protein